MTYEEAKCTETHVPHRNRDGSIEMIEIPSWWKGGVEDVAEAISLVKKGEVEVLCKTPGGRDVTLVRYGKKNNFSRTANYSSAMGAGNFKYYADKSDPDYVPTLCLIGATHGEEFEGTVAINNLIKNIETGTDYEGKENKELMEALEGINLLLIPCLNMDGRARLPIKTVVGLKSHEHVYYAQGAWKNGELCGHPACKATHPIKPEDCSFLGGYFNDDGVNIVHDNFFFPMAEETKAILKLADEYVPDISIHLHGGGNCPGVFWQFDYMPGVVKNKIQELENRVYAGSIRAGLEHVHRHTIVKGNDDREVPPSFNIQSAWTAICGEPCIIYETNQGILYDDESMKKYPRFGFTMEEIYYKHKVLFEESAKYVKELDKRYKWKG